MFGQWFFSHSPLSGHFRSMILMTSSGNTSIGKLPLVSISTVNRSSSRARARPAQAGCTSGSPPVISTRLQAIARHWSTISGIDTFSPP
ncbi:hypothetical protein D3C83_104400 [compost metagenome]